MRGGEECTDNGQVEDDAEGPDGENLGLSLLSLDQAHLLRNMTSG